MKGENSCMNEYPSDVSYKCHVEFYCLTVGNVSPNPKLTKSIILYIIKLLNESLCGTLHDWVNV